jgi:hypothetical protein
MSKGSLRIEKDFLIMIYKEDSNLPSFLTDKGFVQDAS